MTISSRISDALRLFKKLSLRKIWNWSLIYTSYILSRWTRRSIHWGMPASLSIEPTTACNLRCPECPSGLRSFTRDTGNLKRDFFSQLIEECGQDLINLTFYFQGEPFINPDFLEMVDHAHRQGIYTTTSTNGHFLNAENCRKTIDSGLDRLIISVDGATQKTYEQYRKEGQLEKVLEGTRRLVSLKKELGVKHPYIIFQCLVVRPNEEEIEAIHELARDIGVDEVKLKTAQLYDYENGHDLMPRRDQFSRYRKRADGTYEPKGKQSNECWKLWHSGVITWNGLFVPCCFDKDARHVFGNVREAGLMNTWKGEKARAFRHRIMTGRRSIDICTNCTEGCTIWA